MNSSFCVCLCVEESTPERICKYFGENFRLSVKPLPFMEHWLNTFTFTEYYVIQNIGFTKY